MATDRELALMKAALEAAAKTCGSSFAWERIRALDPAAIVASVPEAEPWVGPPDLFEENRRLRQRVEELEQDAIICRDAIEDSVILVTEWCEQHDSDNDAACGRAALRKLSESIGKAAPRLLMENPEGQKLYGLHWKELRQRITDLEHALDADQEHIAMLERQLSEANGEVKP